MTRAAVTHRQTARLARTLLAALEHTNWQLFLYAKPSETATLDLCRDNRALLGRAKQQLKSATSK